MSYHGDFSCKKDLCYEFKIDEGKLEGCQVLVAMYSQGSYEGTAFVLFAKGDVLYEVHGSHCSCYGLEEQWDPEETTHEALAHRMEKGSLFYTYGDVDMDSVHKEVKDAISWYYVLREFDQLIERGDVKEH